MTRDEMLKISWRAYQEIHYKHPRMDTPILCLLIEINFDEESMTLQPFLDEKYINKDFIAGIQHCSIPRKKMMAEIVHGKKVTNKKNLPEYKGSLNMVNPCFKKI